MKTSRNEVVISYWKGAKQYDVTCWRAGVGMWGTAMYFSIEDARNKAKQWQQRYPTLTIRERTETFPGGKQNVTR